MSSIRLHLRRLSTVVGLCLVGPISGAARADDAAMPTFYRDVLPILQDSCQDCHRPSGTNFGGMVAPMSLLTYEEVRPWARAIARQVSAREMPPWDADPAFHGVFANERTLSEEQIAAIRGWVAAGAPAGDAADAPPPRAFASVGGWLHGLPDLVVDLPVAYEIGDAVADQYTAFAVDLTPEMLPEDVYIQGFQCKPGTDIVHHFNAHILYPDAEGRLPPPPDKPESATVAPQGAGMYLGGVSSGSGATMYPEGYGIPLRRGTRVTFDIHYHKEPGPGTRVVDRASQIGFYFTKEPPRSAVGGVSLFEFDIEIPPGVAEHRIGPIARPVPQDSEIVALMPHMHMRGKRAKFEAFYPDGSHEVLLEVPTYDFSWQTVYYYETLKPVPEGTRIEYTAWYDNSEAYGALRGFDPTQTVRFGQASTDEMTMGFVMLAPVVD
ncbi:MAG: hypothetical protein R3190_04995 [Thermoanaerobaculia bacterium]|nr:hypothetical protein [Thermoanaerobaculia bacterium]